VGLNGVGIKAVNALSSSFIIRSFREGQIKEIEFRAGEIVRDEPLRKTEEENGTEVIFTPDEAMFGNYHYILEYVESMMKNYSYLNAGMIINLNGNKIVSRNGLVDLLNDNMNREGLYPIIHLKGDDIEIAMTHGMQYGEDYYSFVNGQHTSQGGTHLIAFREAITRTVKEFFKKDFDPSDIRSSIIAAISVKIEEPIFESQTKTKLGSKDMGPGGPSVRNYVVDFIRKHLDDFLHKNGETARILLKKIQESEKERKAISSIQKLARERAKKVSLHNRKLRDCRIHYNSNDERKLESTLFITEGDSASGSITKSRNVETQAVFSLRGKPLNSYGLTKKIVYENEEFNLLQAALNIEESLDDLRYNYVVIATDADVDGMHIRLLLLTFFLQFFPDLVRKGHVYILQTPLFRVRNKKHTRYCYSDEERQKAIKDLGPDPEITRFKGLGEISPDEFIHFIGKDMRLEPVIMKKSDPYTQFLEFYMGKNTPERQDFIIDNLRVEEEIPEAAQA
jgi:topoisomerase-4 subunit B